MSGTEYILQVLCVMIHYLISYRIFFNDLLQWREPITESGKGVKGQSSLLASSVQFHTKLYPYARKYPPNPRFPEKMTDLVEYVYSKFTLHWTFSCENTGIWRDVIVWSFADPMPTEQITYSQTAFMGTLYGAVALLSWSGQPPNPKPNDPTDSESKKSTVLTNLWLPPFSFPSKIIGFGPFQCLKYPLWKRCTTVLLLEFCVIHSLATWHSPLEVMYLRFGTSTKWYVSMIYG